MGDTSSEPITMVVELNEPQMRALAMAANPDPLVSRDEGVARASMAYERKRLALEEAEAARTPQVMMSAFGGVASLGDLSDRNGRYGLYGLRFTLSLPMFDASATRRVAEARLEAEDADLERRTTTEMIRRQTSTLWLGIAALEKRIGLLEQAVDVAKKREESVVRLVSAGVRKENDLAEAAAERTRRESDLIGARVELWKFEQLLKHKTEEPPPAQVASAGK
jgi:outer membrane protein TolC